MKIQMTSHRSKWQLVNLNIRLHDVRLSQSLTLLKLHLVVYTANQVDNKSWFWKSMWMIKKISLLSLLIPFITYVHNLRFFHWTVIVMMSLLMIASLFRAALTVTHFILVSSFVHGKPPGRKMVHMWNAWK